MKRKSFWIQKAVRRKGSLKRWAKKHRLMHNGKIDLDRAYEYAKKRKLTKRLRQINLARTLRKFKE